jgi:DNA-directed RNA polymerase specialized sigma24 family protein
MTPKGSISHLLGQLKGGDDDAVRGLWQRYFRRLVGLARLRLQDTPRRAADEEDVALSAFASFCRGVDEGRFPKLDDRDDLWHILVTLTARKAASLRRYESQQKRQGGAELSLEEIISDEPTPEFAAEVADECRALLDRLQDESLVAVALAKMEGWTTAEIAGRLRFSPRTVERKLELIRDIWQAENTP